ncbi:hypothetical protein HWV62_31877 [Athelia sp. TMB]|nr:hypothetical protein HWV62_31877 [Athelia sp. TMB]
MPDELFLIIEERPGHNVKLYQYSSKNAEEIVKRHASFDGDQDARGPSDFASGSAKLDDADEEDGEDEEDAATPVPAPPNKGKAAKVEPDLDYLVHRPMTIPNPPTGRLSSSTSRMAIPSQTSTHDGPGPSKKPRTGPPQRRDLDGMVDMDLLSQAYAAAAQSSSYPPPSHSSRLGGPGGGPFYPPPGSAPPNPNMMYLAGLPSHRFPSSSGPARGGGGMYPPPMSQEVQDYFMRMSAQQYQAQFAAQAQARSQATTHPHPHYMPPPSADFIEQLLRDTSTQPPPGFSSIDWPMHGPSSAVSSQQQHPTPQRSHSGGGDLPSWIDFLSTQAPPPPMDAYPAGMSISPPLPSSSGMSPAVPARSGASAAFVDSTRSTASPRVAAKKEKSAAAGSKRGRTVSNAVAAGKAKKGAKKVDSEVEAEMHITAGEDGDGDEERDTDGGVGQVKDEEKGAAMSKGEAGDE